MRPMRAVFQGFQCSIISLLPAVDELAAYIVSSCCFCHTFFQRIFNYGLTATGNLCYSIHSGFVKPPVAFILRNLTVTQVSLFRYSFF